MYCVFNTDSTLISISLCRFSKSAQLCCSIMAYHSVSWSVSGPHTEDWINNQVPTGPPLPAHSPCSTRRGNELLMPLCTFKPPLTNPPILQHPLLHTMNHLDLLAFTRVNKLFRPSFPLGFFHPLMGHLQICRKYSQDLHKQLN